MSSSPELAFADQDDQFGEDHHGFESVAFARIEAPTGSVRTGGSSDSAARTASPTLSLLPPVDQEESGDPSPLTFDNFVSEGRWTRYASGAIADTSVLESAMADLADEVSSRARAEGYTAGWAEGRKEAAVAQAAAEAEREERFVAEQERRDAEHREALATLAEAALVLRDAVEAVSEQVATHATGVAVELVEELLGHELRVASNPGVEAVISALDLVPQEALVSITLSPEEASAAAEVLPHLAAKISIDPTFPRGDMALNLVDGVIERRISTAAQRVREVLLSAHAVQIASAAAASPEQ